MRIIIEGNPKYQKRHRHHGKRTWDPSAADKKRIRGAMLPFKPASPILEPLTVTITAFFPFLKSWSNSLTERAEGMIKVTKPDADNIGKLYLDAMNGLIYHDDNQVVNLHVHKRYSQKPCVVIDVKTVREEPT